MLSPVCLSSVTFVHSTQRVKIYRQYFYAVWYMAIRWHSLKLLRRSSQGNPYVGGFKRKRSSKYITIFDISKAISRKRCKIAAQLVLITDRKSYMSFRLAPKSVTLNDPERRNDPYFALFYEFGSFRSALHKIGWQSHNYGQFTITISSI